MSTTTDRAAWLEERRKRIGASDVSAILGLNPWRTPHEVWLDKTGRLDDWNGNAATRMGQLLEGWLLDRAQSDLGDIERDVVVWADTRTPIAATLDGRVFESGDVIECKTAGTQTAFAKWDDWGEPGTDQVPEYYLVQCQTQLMCAGADRAWVYALLNGAGPMFRRYEIARNEIVIERIAEFCGWWWDEHVRGDTPPDPDAPVPMSVVSRIRRKPGAVVDLDERAEWLVKRRERLTRHRRWLAKELERVDSEITLALGQAEAGELPDGRLVTYYEQQRKMPAKAAYTQTFRQLRITKGKK